MGYYSILWDIISPACVRMFSRSTPVGRTRSTFMSVKLPCLRFRVFAPGIEGSILVVA